jgi:hypothetical protein
MQRYLWRILEHSSILGRFHVKGPRKKVNVKKWIFFYEMWKIMGQIDDFDRFLNNSCNLGVFLAKNQKYQKWLFWKSENWKKEEKILKIDKLISYIIYNILIVWFFWFCVFVLSFAMFYAIFYRFNDFHVFQTPSRFQRFNISTKQNFLPNKKSRSTP